MNAVSGQSYSEDNLITVTTPLMYVSAVFLGQHTVTNANLNLEAILLPWPWKC